MYKVRGWLVQCLAKLARCVLHPSAAIRTGLQPLHYCWLWGSFVLEQLLLLPTGCLLPAVGCVLRGLASFGVFFGLVVLAGWFFGTTCVSCTNCNRLLVSAAL